MSQVMKNETSNTKTKYKLSWHIPKGLKVLIMNWRLGGV
jgi:hypothetical protein